MAPFQMGFTVEGLPSLQRRLSGAERAVSGQALATVVLKAALIMEGEWKARVPVRTGTYRRSIHAKITDIGAHHAEARVGTSLADPPYPLYLEFGTAHMAPRPSARPAYDAALPRMTRVIDEGIAAAVRAGR